MKNSRMILTVDYGWIRIVNRSEINKKFDELLEFDLVGEWEYWLIHDIDPRKDCEIVAVRADFE